MRRTLARALLLAASLPLTVLYSPPTLAVGAPQDVRIPQLKARAVPPPARFSHWRHNTQYCFSCHPALFAMAPAGFTHEEMRAGKACGACHDGRAAAAVAAMTCEGCHAATR